MTEREPCLAMWSGCPQSADESHTCHRKDGHEGRCRCAYCGATTADIDPIFYDAEELEEALEALGD